MPDATNNPTNSTAELDQKKEQARLAMEGAEWTAKRETDARVKTAKEELAKLDEQLGKIRAEKEKLELDWVALDDARRKIRKVLEPILVEEKKIEAEETALETEEERIGVPSEKQPVEKKRWEVQERRQAVEQKKWVEEDRMIAIEKTINENTTRYRQFLDEEEKLQTKADQLKAEAGV